MSLILMDNILPNVDRYVDKIYQEEFYDFQDGDNTFRNIQIRPNTDLFCKFLSDLFPQFFVSLNIVRRSPYMQEEPNFVHTDEEMGDFTCILYLNKNHPDDDGTTIYDDDGNPSMIVKSKYNRMFCFDSRLPHSRNLYENFGDGKDARLIQVVFLNLDHEKL
jgi:hypothetical protein